MPEFTTCAHCGESLSDEGVKTPTGTVHLRCALKIPRSSQDTLSASWKLVVWLSLVVGPVLPIVISLLMFYVWRGRFPQKAVEIRRYGFKMWILGCFLWAVLYSLFSRTSSSGVTP